MWDGVAFLPPAQQPQPASGPRPEAPDPHSDRSRRPVRLAAGASPAPSPLQMPPERRYPRRGMAGSAGHLGNPGKYSMLQEHFFRRLTMPKRWALFCMIPALVLLSVLLVACGDHAGPPAQELRQQVANHIQPIWRVDSFTIEASENEGSNVEPRYRSRFRADVSTVDATYESVGRFANADVLRQVRPAGYRETIHGFTSARLVEGSWRVQVDIQSGRHGGSGRLRSAFPGRTVIENSPELRAMQEEWSALVATAERHWTGLLRRGEFRGASTDGRQTWPFVVDQIAFDGRLGFTGRITFPSLDAVHAVRGSIVGQQLVFRNIRAIQRGNATLNCEYTIDVRGEAAGFGIYRCSSAVGTVRIAFDPAEVIVARTAERNAAFEAFRNALAGTWTSDSPLRNARGDAMGSGDNRIHYQIVIPAGTERSGQARVSLFTRPETGNRVEIMAPFEVTDSEMRWSDGDVTLMRDARGNTPWVWSTNNARWAGRLVDGRLHIAMQEGSRMGGGWTAVLSRQ
jgi:hypothetical protein